MIKPKKKPTVSSNIDGNAFAIMAVTEKALRKAGADNEYIEQYRTEAMKGNYHHLVATTMEYVNFD